jgi:hypothetical protein
MPTPTFIAPLSHSVGVGRYTGVVGDDQPSRRVVLSLTRCGGPAAPIATPDARNARNRLSGGFSRA